MASTNARRSRSGMTCPTESIIGRSPTPRRSRITDRSMARKRRDSMPTGMSIVRSPTNSEPSLNVVANEHVDGDDIRAPESHEWSDDQVVGDRHRCRVHRERALETSVNGEHRGNPAATGPDRAHPGEVEELAVLVHNVGFEFVEDAKQPPQVLRRGREEDVVVESELRCQCAARKAHDPEPVALLLGRGVAIRGGQRPALRALPPRRTGRANRSCARFRPREVERSCSQPPTRTQQS